MTSRLRSSPQLVGALALVVIAYAYFAFTTAGFASVNNTYTIVQGMVFLGLGALAMGLTMIAGEFDLAVPSTAAVGGILAIQASGHGVLVAVLCAVAVGLVIGVLQGVMISWLRINSLAFTIGTQIALGGVAFLLASGKTVVASDLTIADAVQNQIFIFSPGSLVAIALFVIVGVFLRATRYGAELRAFGGGRQEALAAGVPYWRPVVIAFTCSGMLAGLLGALASISVGSASSTAFASLLVNAVAAALIGGVALTGGRGTALGIAAGVLVLRIVNSGLSLQGAAFYVVNLAIGLILIAVILADLVLGDGPLNRRWRAWRATRRPPPAEAARAG